MGNSNSANISTETVQPKSISVCHDNVAFFETSLTVESPEDEERSRTGSKNVDGAEQIPPPEIRINNGAATSDSHNSIAVTQNNYNEKIKSSENTKSVKVNENANEYAEANDVNNPDVVVCTKTLYPGTFASEAQLRQRPVKRHFSFGDKPGNFGVSEINTDIPPIERFLLGRADFKEVKHPAKQILITEVAPSNSSIYEDDPNKWKMPLQTFSSKKMELGQELKHKSKRIRSYYKAQNSLITSFEEIQLGLQDEMETADIMKKLASASMLLAKLSFGVNLLLLVGKTAASVLSGSMSIISSLVDSSVDLLSGVILWWATRAVKKRDPYVYPQGRTKLEPIAVVIISVVMTVASLQLVRESVEKAIDLSNRSSSLPDIDITTFVIAGCTVVFKFILWLICRRVKTSAAQTLALDHRNDVASNLVAIVCGYIGSSGMYKQVGIYDLCYVDPIGAIIISFYIVYNWWQAGSEQIKLLTGHTAHPEFLSKLTWICMNHDKEISHIESVRAFHFGTNFLVEVDIVLPGTMTLMQAHDIGEPLQQKLESLPEVERAFVHVDYDATHDPTMEHKIV